MFGDLWTSANIIEFFEIREINAEIERFNSVLAKFKFAPLDASDQSSWFIVAGVPWSKPQLWPSTDCPGVYVLCAHDEGAPERVAAYVGKASLQNMGAEIGAKLYGSSQREKGIYTMMDLSGQTFVIEAVITTGVRDKSMRFLASALEEFIIDGVQEEINGVPRVHLLNGTGVER
jgi:hypothetical protein